MKRVAIDLRMAAHTGVGRYVRCLVNALVTESAGGGGWTVSALADPGQDLGWLKGTVAVSHPSRPVPVYSLREQLVLGRLLDRMECVVAHIPHYTFPLRPPRTPVVSTVHDLIYLETRGAGRTSLHEAAARAMIRRAARRAARIVAVSQDAKSRIVRFLRVPADRIRVIHHGREHVVPPARARPRGEATLLYVGNHLPHKNLPFLMRVFRGVLAARPDARLVLAGPSGRHTPAIREAAAREGVSERIVWASPAADEALWSLYAGATLLVFPSRIEGFGFPVLEAMALGLPVVAAAASAIPEVAGDAAALLPPDDEAGWVREVVSLLADPARREDLALRGRSRAEAFSWRRAARETLDVYEEVLASRGSWR